MIHTISTIAEFVQCVQHEMGVFVSLTDTHKAQSAQTVHFVHYDVMKCTSNARFRARRAFRATIVHLLTHSDTQ
jgi:hypothetical protein